MIGKLIISAVLGAGLLFAQGSWLKDRKNLLVLPPTRIDVTDKPEAPQDPPKPSKGRCSIPLLRFGKPPANYRPAMPMIDTGEFPVSKRFYVDPPAPPCDAKEWTALDKLQNEKPK